MKAIYTLALMAMCAMSTQAQVNNEQPQSVVSDVISGNSGVAPTTTALSQKSQPTLTNAQLSERYKLQIQVIDNEIKTLKSMLKLHKGDGVASAELTQRLASKKAEMADIKAKKTIADKAVKAEKASKKAAEAAEKARKKAAAAAEKAAMLQK